MSCGGEKGIEEMAAMRDEERGTPKNKRSIEKEKEEKEGETEGKKWIKKSAILMEKRAGSAQGCRAGLSPSLALTPRKKAGER